MAENNSHSSYFMMKYNIKRDEFLEFVRLNDKNSAMNKQHTQYLNGIIKNGSKNKFN